MAGNHSCHRISQPPQGLGICFGQLALTNPIGAGISFRPPKHAGKNRSLAVTTHTQLCRLSTADQNLPTSTVDMKQLVDFLYDDLPRVFDDQGIHTKLYDKKLKFRDPITKHDSIGGYLFNIGLLKKLFRPHVRLHWVKQVCFFTVQSSQEDELFDAILDNTFWLIVLRFPQRKVIWHIGFCILFPSFVIIFMQS